MSDTQAILSAWIQGKIDFDRAITMLELSEMELSEDIKWLQNNPSSNALIHTFESQSKNEKRLQLIKIEQAINVMKERANNRQKGSAPIVWGGSQADLSRIYKDLFNAGLITVSGRDFSKHFVKRNGDPMPEDFQESKGTKQDTFSRKQEVAAIQKRIRGMEKESGE